MLFNSPDFPRFQWEGDKPYCYERYGDREDLENKAERAKQKGEIEDFKIIEGQEANALYIR